VARLRLDSAPEPVLERDERVRALEVVAADPSTAEDYVQRIAALWGRAQSAFLDIGRLLIRAKETLPHGEYMTAVEQRLPFASRTAYQLREAARWAIEMDRRKTIPLDRLPGSYSTIYLLSTLDPTALEAAEGEGLIRPELRRAELLAWRKAKETPTDGREALRAQRERLIRERMRLDAELRRIESELEG
jgi:hypothetical protein